MLFFFELGLFLLIMVTLGLGEFVGRGAALAVWLVATTASIVAYGLARRALVPTTVPADPAAALDARWARTLLHYWGRTNLLLLLGACGLGGWYLLAAGPR